LLNVAGPGEGVPVADVDQQRARVFGGLAAEYARWRPSYPDAAVDWLLPAGATRVVDLGAGTGKLTGLLLARGLRVDAVEPDPEMLVVLARLHPAATAHQAGADALPVPDASVDAVLVGQAWHWFPKEQAVAEVRRVLRPGGQLGLVWNAYEPREQWERDFVAADPDSTGEDDEWGEHPSIPGLPEGVPEGAVFRWTEQLTAAALRARMSTHSAYAIMDPAERERRLDAGAGLLAAEAARLGTDTVGVHYAAYCARWRP
jgi:SAM-dependent methyltransferase